MLNEHTRVGPRLRHLLAALLLAGSAAAALLVGSPAPAGAATCFGDYCSGRDPQTSGCAADAYTVASRPFQAAGGVLELRWSPSARRTGHVWRARGQTKTRVS